MNMARTIAVASIAPLLAACGDGSNSSGTQGESTTSGTVPATETDSDPTPQTGTGGSGQSRPSGG